MSIRHSSNQPAASKPKRPTTHKSKKTSNVDQSKQSRQQHQRRKARSQAKIEAKREAETSKLIALPITNNHAAGIDVGKESHWVCVGFTNNPDTDEHLVREYLSDTQDLQAIARWLRECGVTTVAMESSGHYWVVLYEMLQSEGFEVLLVDPSYTKQVRGRPKTDKRDCQWIYRLHSCGLLAAAFRPDEQTCKLRAYLRQRANLVRYAGQHIQHMEKALEQMNLKLSVVLSDITGTTGRKIIQAILRGTRDPHKLAQHRHENCKASEEEIARALTGVYREEHLFELKQAWEAWKFYHQQLDVVDERIRLQLARMKTDRALPPLPPKPRRSRKPNDPGFDVRTALYYVIGIDLTEIEGINEVSALKVISEIGPNVSKFATVKHFCSWLGLCPQFKKTGGRVKSSRTRPGANRCAVALRMSAQSLWHSKSALGAYYRRMKSRLGAPAANTAAAHKLARLVYYALKHGMPYVRQSQQEYEQKMRARQIKSVIRKARMLGLKVELPLLASEVPIDTNGDNKADHKVAEQTGK
ncbi:MAG: IS110 family transposase [Pirellulales bacterium]|nr:IS110 family transposase [Pirellulales bacterium]